MTTNDDVHAERPDGEPSEIESLLPWYEVGRLSQRERQRVEEALHDNPELARHAELVREEYAETIHLNEMLGAPSTRVMDRLMAAIESEDVARRRGSVRAVATRFRNFISSFSPRTLAYAASLATLAIGLQAFALVGMLTKPQGDIASLGEAHRGSFAVIRFTRQANAAEITDFLQNYQATVVDGPRPGGLYRVKLAMTSLAREELDRIVSRMRRERVIEFAGADQAVE
jgi:anti-sigma-K factor RskA